MSGSTITGLPGAPEVYASAQRTARFPTAQLISLAGAEDDGGRHLVQQLAAPGQLDEERRTGIVAAVHAAASYRVSRGTEDDGGRHRFEFITGHYFAMAGLYDFSRCLYEISVCLRVCVNFVRLVELLS